jgi:hypothetical protein
MGERRSWAYDETSGSSVLTTIPEFDGVSRVRGEERVFTHPH